MEGHGLRVGTPRSWERPESPCRPTRLGAGLWARPSFHPASLPAWPDSAGPRPSRGQRYRLSLPSQRPEPGSTRGPPLPQLLSPGRGLRPPRPARAGLHKHFSRCALFLPCRDLHSRQSWLFPGQSGLCPHGDPVGDLGFVQRWAQEPRSLAKDLDLRLCGQKTPRVWPWLSLSQPENSVARGAEGQGGLDPLLGQAGGAHHRLGCEKWDFAASRRPTRRVESGAGGAHTAEIAVTIRARSAHQLLPAPRNRPESHRLSGTELESSDGGGRQDRGPEGAGQGCENQRMPLPALPLHGAHDHPSPDLDPGSWPLRGVEVGLWNQRAPRLPGSHAIPSQGRRGGTQAQSTETKRIQDVPSNSSAQASRLSALGGTCQHPLPDSRQQPGSHASRLTVPGCRQAPSPLPPTGSRLP